MSVLKGSKDQMCSSHSRQSDLLMRSAIYLKKFQQLTINPSKQGHIIQFTNKLKGTVDSTQDSDKTIQSKENKSKNALKMVLNDKFKNKHLCKSTIVQNSVTQNISRLSNWRQCMNQKKLEQCEKNTKKQQRQNMKLRFQNEKLKVQNLILKNKVQLLNKFKIYYEQAQLQIQLLEKKGQHYRSDLAYYQQIIDQFTKKTDRSIKKFRSPVKIKTIQINSESLLRIDFTFSRKPQDERQLQSSLSFKSTVEQKSQQKDNRQQLQQDLLIHLSKSAISQDSQQSFKNIKYDQEVLFGQQFFQKDLF